MNIMDMETGTKIKNTWSGRTYLLGDYVNDVARGLCDCTNLGNVDYINKYTQCDYVVVEQK